MTMKETALEAPITPEMLWENYHEPIAGFVRNRTNRHPDAEDIVQTIFMKAYRHLPDLQDETKLRAWMYQIARNAITDHFCKEKTTGPLPEQILDREEEAADYTEEAVAGMKGVFPYLPDKYREAVELSELKGMSQKELSERLGISYSGAKSRVQRGREMVRDLMNSCCSIETDRYGHIVHYEVVHPRPLGIKGKKRGPAASEAASPNEDI
ncbi:RNA polymerase sigma factor SigZ [Cohnella thailandensis]|uniref:RNA polymerase sigma factor SigZ n=1 Tax=Cohnella thailandensis TaxID=557557 RepID=A0A841T4I7_9BACL|nr:RNA polymerase sigma factor SigZ [Cohnella thailandensis]MBB6637909.1 RNA polymerase sigma factor SigZ [Cohnella thailandensis]MBP1977383.1 RNA polymerase sigma-70 factor (ECF subfamily) [Cohnella thailandensis]